MSISSKQKHISSGLTSVHDPAAPALLIVSFPPAMMLTITSPAVCFINLLFTILVTLSLPPPNPPSAPCPPTPAETHSGLGSSMLTLRPPGESLCTLSPDCVTPPCERLLHTFLKNSWTRPPYLWEPASGTQAAAPEGFPAGGGCLAGLAPWLAPNVKQKSKTGILMICRNWLLTTWILEVFTVKSWPLKTLLKGMDPSKQDWELFPYGGNLCPSSAF